MDLQKKLLRAAIEMLKLGGVLVYSTCSLYPQEGEHHFEDTNLPLEPCTLPEWIPPPYKTKKDKGESMGMGRFVPDDQNATGFFIAKFRKIAEK